MSHQLAQLACPKCRWLSLCGPVQMLDWLRGAKMVRRDAQPEADLLAELFRAAATRFACPHCGAHGLTVSEPPVEDNEDWLMARSCESCGGPIARERLEVFPDVRLCTACQQRLDSGEAEVAQEYCPRCGSHMKLTQSRRGITRYVMTCPKCR